MEYSETQITRLRYLLSDQWACDCNEMTERNLDSALSMIESTEELYQFVGNMNTDGATDCFRKALVHPLCDKGIALLIYCRMSPGFYYWMLGRNKPIPPWAEESYALVKDIESKFRDGFFSRSIIRIDPHNFCGRDLLNENRPNPGNRMIPDFMKSPTAGRDVELVQVF